MNLDNRQLTSNDSFEISNVLLFRCGYKSLLINLRSHAVKMSFSNLTIGHLIVPTLIQWIIPFDQVWLQKFLKWRFVTLNICARLVLAWEQISQEEVDRFFQSFRKRVRACVDAEGKCFEYKLKKSKWMCCLS